MTLEEFITKYTDQDVNFPGCPTNSCMALMHLYLQDVLMITDQNTLSQPFASELASNFNTVPGHEHFAFTANTPEGIPQSGDLVVWGQNAQAGIPEGHVAVFRDGNVNGFYSFDSNFPIGSKPHIQEHSYVDVAGWLRFTGALPANTYKGLDLSNEASVKAAIDTWDEVANQGLFVRKSEIQPQLDNLNTQVQALTNHSNELKAQLDTSKPPEGSTVLTPDTKQSLLDRFSALLAEFTDKFNAS